MNTAPIPPADSTDAPSKRRRIRALTRKLHVERRRTWAALAVAVAAVLFALRPAPPPDPVVLGKGEAGVRVVVDSVAQASPPVVEEPPAADASVEGETIGDGQASYYAEELAGQPTASGEPFEPEALTAAHRTLPLGSRIRVTNLRNDESVIVRVNDRGPFAKRRVVDLSKAAAREIGMLKRGTARVRLELLPARG